MIIEMCGIPGCGKTTLVSFLNSKKTFFQRNDFLTQETLFGKIYKRIIYFSFFKINFLRSTKIIKMFVNQFKDCDKKYICRLLDMYVATKLCKKNSLFILDEGPIQYITSIPYKDQLPSNKSLEKLLKLFYSKDKNLVISFRVDIELAIQRIKKRNSTNDRYNLDNHFLLNELLKQKYNNLEIALNTAKALGLIKVLQYDNETQILSALNFETKAYEQ